MLSKCEEDRVWVVPFCWVIDSIKRSAWEYHAESEPARVSTTLLAGDLKIDLAELFYALDGQ